MLDVAELFIFFRIHLFKIVLILQYTPLNFELLQRWAAQIAFNLRALSLAALKFT